MTAVPTINLTLAQTSATERARLDLACRDHGFFLLTDHGIDAEIAAMWHASAVFFALPQAAKRKVSRSEQQPLGYYDQELTERKRDLKEVFDFMPEAPAGSSPKPSLNRWPDDQPHFKSALCEFTEAAGLLAQRTLALVFQALSQQSTSVTQEHQLPTGAHRTSNIRLNYYPTSDPLTKLERRTVTKLGDMALHAHTDPGILTLLVQDQVGGLQTLSKSEGWIDVPPAEGAIVVNLGDAMQVWTNDAYVAATHRVLPMRGKARYSTPYFFNPPGNTTLAPLPALTNAPPAYRPFTWKEFIQARVTDNYADLGAPDTQISHYRVA